MLSKGTLLPSVKLETLQNVSNQLKRLCRKKIH